MTIRENYNGCQIDCIQGFRVDLKGEYWHILLRDMARFWFENMRNMQK